MTQQGVVAYSEKLVSNSYNRPLNSMRSGWNSTGIMDFNATDCEVLRIETSNMDRTFTVDDRDLKSVPEQREFEYRYIVHCNYVLPDSITFSDTQIRNSSITLVWTASCFRSDDLFPCNPSTSLSAHSP